MAKPVINTILNFDSMRGTSCSFTLPGDVSYGNKIQVFDSATTNLVYEYPKTIKAEKSPVKLLCTIPGNVLQNGKRYYAQIQVANASGVVTGVSNKMGFYCLTTPTLTFNNVQSGQEIGSSHYEVTASYYQPEGEKLQSYRFGLYDRNRVLVYESTILYDSSEMKFRYKNLSTGSKYYFRVTGVTVRGLTCDSGFVEVTAKYTVKEDYAQIELVNEYFKGYITYSTNIRLVGFDLDNRRYLFLASGYLGSVDLTGRNPNYEREINYTNGFIINKDWTMHLRGYMFSPNEKILTFYNDDGQYIVISFHRIDDKCYFKCVISDGVTKYVRYTNRVAYSSAKIMTIYLRRIDDLVDFRLYDGTQTVDFGDISLYQDSNGNLFANYPDMAAEYFSYVDPSLYYVGHRDIWYDAATGNAYERISN